MNSNIARKLLCAGAMTFVLSAGLVSNAQAQDADARAETYASLLQQISDKKLSIAQKQAYIANQQARIQSLQSQIDTLPAKKEAIRPIIANMVAEIEKVIVSDVPFREVERFNRLEDLKADLNNPEVGESALFRRAMTLYDVEANYGNSVGSYTGNSPINPGTRFAACQANIESAKCDVTDDIRKALKGGAELGDLEDSLQDGNYLHFGRLSLVYLELDSSEGYKYNNQTSEWEKLDGAEILGIRKAVRIARGESAPGVVRGPVRLAGGAQ